MNEINHEWGCRVCGSIGKGEEFEKENGDIEIICPCGHSETIEVKDG